MSECELFQKIAGDVWDTIASNHKRSNRLSEEGITRNTVISDIQDYVENRRLFKVFAQKSDNEPKEGADLEVYIQKGYNSYQRVLLQAKITELDDDLENLNKPSGKDGKKQYDTLIDYGKEVNCPTGYLIYQGRKDFHNDRYVDCADGHDERQFGCAILSPKVIKDHCDKYLIGRISDADIEFPFGTPWRFLTCCDNYMFNQDDYRTYTREQIDMDDYFENLFTPLPPMSFIIGGQGPNRSLTERQNIKLHNLGWNPIARVIISANRMVSSSGLLKIKI